MANKRGAVALNLLGTVIGAGVFGLPAVFAKAGILGGTLIFAGLTVVALLLHLIFLDLILSVKGDHRVPGYIGQSLGRGGYWLSLAVMICKFSATILAYIILGGTFMNSLAQGAGLQGNLFIWQILFWIGGAVVVFFGLRTVTSVENELSWLLIGGMIFSVIALCPFMDWKIIIQSHPIGFMGALGVMFFSVNAVPVLPEMADIANRRKKDARLGVIYGTLAAAALSWIFAISIAAVYPQIKGVEDIQNAFPQIFWWLIPVVGFLAIITSYLTVSQSFKNTLHLDLKLKPWMAWSVAFVLPLILFLWVSHNFLDTIGFVGSVLAAFIGLLICWATFKRFYKNSKVNLLWRLVPLPVGLVMFALIVQKLFSL